MRHALRAMRDASRVTMQIRLNGKAREVADGITIGRLLDELTLQPLRVAVQVNMDIVKRERFGEVALQPGDTVEILTFMSGG
jgi:thiamine biosynthesis protein ThiS